MDEHKLKLLAHLAVHDPERLRKLLGVTGDGLGGGEGSEATPRDAKIRVVQADLRRIEAEIEQEKLRGCKVELQLGEAEAVIQASRDAVQLELDRLASLYHKYCTTANQRRLEANELGQKIHVLEETREAALEQEHVAIERAALVVAHQGIQEKTLAELPTELPKHLLKKRAAYERRLRHFENKRAGALRRLEKLLGKSDNQKEE